MMCYKNKNDNNNKNKNETWRLLLQVVGPQSGGSMQFFEVERSHQTLTGSSWVWLRLQDGDPFSERL